MPHILLATAAAFKPRSSAIVVLETTADPPWLWRMLKEIGIHKKDRVDSIRSKKALSKVLSSPDATRTLYSLTLQSKPGSQLQKHPNLLVETISNYQIIHIEAYVVYVDLVQSKELAFKSTPESISGLAKYRRHIHLVDARNGRSEEAEKLQHEFIELVNGFVYRTDCEALLGFTSGGLSQGVTKSRMGLASSN